MPKLVYFRQREWNWVKDQRLPYKMRLVAIQVAFKHCCKCHLHTIRLPQLDIRSIHMIKMNTESHDNTNTYIHPLICLYLCGSLCRCFCLLCSTGGSHALFLTSHSHSALGFFPRKVLLFNHFIYTVMKKHTLISAWIRVQLLFLPEKLTANLHSVLKSTPSSEAFERPLISPQF